MKSGRWSTLVTDAVNALVCLVHFECRTVFCFDCPAFLPLRDTISNPLVLLSIPPHMDLSPAVLWVVVWVCWLSDGAFRVLCCCNGLAVDALRHWSSHAFS